MRETGLNALMKVVLRFLLTLVGCVAGYQIALMLLRVQPEWLADIAHPNILMASCIVIFALVGFMIMPFVWWIIKKIGALFENMLQNVGVRDISAAVMGMLLFLLLANLIAIPFRDIENIGFYIAIALNIVFALVGMRLFVRKREAIWGVITNILERSERKIKGRDTADGDSADRSSSVTGAYAKVADTSALIDGRILDIASTGFLEGQIVLPRFVLTELQGVADSTDPVKRARGRKGLHVVSELQKLAGMSVRIEDITIRELNRDKVDEALVELCKRLGARIITTDFNLNQVSKIEGVMVLNVNDLANSLKPQFLPGDVVSIDVIRQGKERGQGIGYLEDGTMIVVEDGENAIGEKVDVVISSMLQTASGRMVFGKIKR